MFSDADGQWLKVKYGKNNKQIQRFNPNIRSLRHNKHELQIHTNDTTQYNSSSQQTEQKQNLIGIKIMCVFGGNHIELPFQEKYPSLLSLKELISNQFKINNFWLEYLRSDAHEKYEEIFDNIDFDEAIQSIYDTNKNILQIVVRKYVENDIPLNKFSRVDICGAITKWLYNDIDFKKNILKTKKIFSNHELSGSKMIILSGEDAKRIVKEEMLPFVTAETLDIMFNGFDQWKQGYVDSVSAKTAEQIASILFHYPLNQLLKRIKKEGHKFLKRKNASNVIQNKTGWNDDEIRQIKLLLFKHIALTKNEFIDNMNKILSENENEYKQQMTDVVIDKIKKIILDCDVEQLHYDIKNNRDNRNTQDFSENIIKMIDEVMLVNDNINESNLIKRIYAKIAKCFVFDYNDKHDLKDVVSDWICSNCGNYNFQKYINGKMNNDLEYCSLCGITEIESVTLKIRDYDTFIMVKKKKKKQIESTDTDTDTKIYQWPDDLDHDIKKVIDSNKINLRCPNRNDKQNCPEMIRLAKELIKHKKTLQEINDSDIDKTVNVDIGKVNNEKFKQIFMENASQLLEINKLELIDIETLNNLLADGKIMNIDLFSKTDRNTFAKKWTKKHTKIKPAAAGKLYFAIRDSLLKTAQTEQQGEFPRNIDMDVIEKDYHHVINTHIEHEHKESMYAQNAYKFYETIIHYDDNESQIKECKSVQRNIRRRSRFVSQQNTTRNYNNMTEDKNIWTLNEFYNQTQLDIIHYFLAHSRLNDVGNEYDIDEKKQYNSSQNKDKY
eukprot:511058_1